MSFRTLLAAGAALLLIGQAASAKDLKSVGISVGSLGNPYFISMVNSVKREAQKINPNAAVNAVSSDYDLGKQSNQIDNFIASGVDMILLAAADPNAIAASVKRAEAAGIVVIAVDVEAAGADATVQTDNLAAGRVSCAYLVDRINGKGNVIIQNGPQVSSIIARVKGCKESLAGHPGIKILSDNQNGLVSREGGLNVMSGDLTRFSDIQAVFTVDDPQAVGANLAAAQLHRSDFIITSVDGAPDIVNALKSKTLIQASASQDPAEEGKRGVDIGYGLMNGKSPAQKVTLLAPSLVTRDNVGQYKGW